MIHCAPKKKKKKKTKKKNTTKKTAKSAEDVVLDYTDMAIDVPDFPDLASIQSTPLAKKRPT